MAVSNRCAGFRRFDRRVGYLFRRHWYAGVSVYRVAGSGHVSGDENQVRQLLWNLLDNALKFHDPHRKPEVSIEIDGGEGEDADQGDRSHDEQSD